MKHRKPIEKITQIKDDPDIRIVFPPGNYGDYFGIYKLSKKHHLNIAVMARHVQILWWKKFMDGDDKLKETMLTQVLQSMHGVEQLSILGGGSMLAAIKSATKRKGVKVGEKRKLASKPSR